MTATKTDWFDWHRDYEDPGSTLSHRLAAVQRFLSEALDASPPGPVRVVGLCAGQGRDIAGVLADHPRRADVSGRLVELDPRNTEVAVRLLREAGADDRVEVVTGDASCANVYEGAVPADIVLAVGVFGNITDSDIERLIFSLPAFSKPGARVLWSRGITRRDVNPQIRGWFVDAGFEELEWFLLDQKVGLGVHRYTGELAALASGIKLFDFVGGAALAAQGA